MKTLIQKVLHRLGYRITALPGKEQGNEFETIRERIKPFTMTSYERQRSLYDAISHIEEKSIEGDIVECGVWKGGSSMLMAFALLKRQSANRTLYLYDTYAGMSEPTADDVNLHGRDAATRWQELAHDDMNEWDYASLEEVMANMASTGYPKDKVKFIKGKVEDTIPAILPERIALLRLDTDWYESTKHEMEHLFPRLVTGGILILDDYGHWQGARKAVDEHIEKHNLKLFLIRIDYTGRIAVKV